MYGKYKKSYIKRNTLYIIFFGYPKVINKIIEIELEQF